MSYQHGKAPADAPVTWVPTPTAGIVQVVGIGDSGVYPYLLQTQAHAICQWAHLAKLAGEAEERMQSLVTDCFQDNLEDPCGTGTVADMRQQGFERIAKSQVDKANDWLRRFRAAKGDA